MFCLLLLELEFLARTREDSVQEDCAEETDPEEELDFPGPHRVLPRLAGEGVWMEFTYSFFRDTPAQNQCFLKRLQERLVS